MQKFSTRLVGATTIAALIASSCNKGAQTTPPGGTPPALGSASPISDLVMYQTKDLPLGLDLRLSEGHQGAPGFDHAKLSPAKRIADADANALLARMHPIAADAADQQAFALRPRSTPPPRTGQTIKSVFPAPPSTLLPPKASDAGQPLKVLRWMPEGDVRLAPELSVTFSQPMVAVTSQDDAAAIKPVKLTPTPKGHWRWIGTRTILFDPDVRFPQATTYEVEIPAGTKSAIGNALKDAVRFKFETPAPAMTQMYPTGGPHHLDEPMFVAFDQKIDPQAVIANIHVTAGGKPMAVRLLDRDEVDKDKKLKPLAEAETKQEHDGRWLAFRATSELPTDAQIKVEIAAGTPSAEGPNKTKAAQSYSFRTYPPLKILRAECGYGSVCRPGMPFAIQFNNPLDADRFDDKQIAITPDVPGLKIVQSYSSILVAGVTKAHTTYHVAVAGDVRDEFGQTLGKDAPFSFTVGDAVPTFYGPSGMVVLDPEAKKPTLDVFTTNYTNLKVKLFRVDVSDFDAFRFYMENQWNHDHPPRLPGAKVYDALVKTNPGKDQLVETSVDLAPALSRTGLGHAIAIVEPYPWTVDRDPPRLIAWVQSTKLAVDAHVDADNLIAFATDLDGGKPASGVSLEIRPFGIKASSDDKGLATLPLGKGSTKGAHYLVARRGDDVAFLTESNGSWNEYGSWVQQARSTNYAWYVIDDRKMYRPGEEVSLKGWLRAIDMGKNGDVNGVAGIVTSVDFKVHDASNNQIFAGSAPVNALGGFDTKFTLPKTPNLGWATVQLETRGRIKTSYSHGFQIQEFRRPEFEVSAHASQGPFVVGGAGDVTVSAKYYAGGPLPGAEVHWNVIASQTNFTPPNRDDFIFGAWQPWWGYRSRREPVSKRRAPPQTWSFASKTDGSGEHTLHVDFASVNPALPMSVQAHAAVTDVNRQQWSASAAMIVHPSSLYVGLKTKKPFVEKGTPFPIDVIGVDVDGKPALGSKIEVKTVRLDWEYKKGVYQTKEVDPQTCSVVAAKDPVRCELATPHGGTYEVTATVVDSRGRPNQTTMTFWVAGGELVPQRDVSQERVELIPDKKEYAAGETAELLVQAPFYPAEGLVSWRRSGIVKTERITLTGPTATIKVPVADRMVPNMYVQVDLVGMAARTDDKGDPDPKLPKRPAYAAGAIDLAVPPKQRTLAVKVTPSVGKLAPGERASLALEVRDAAGKPVANAETVVLVVDEAILALAGYQFSNPIDTFYSQRGPDARDYYSRGMVKLAKPSVEQLAELENTRALYRNGAQRYESGGGGGGRVRTTAMPRKKNGGESQSNPLAKDKSYDFDGDTIEGDLLVEEKSKGKNTGGSAKQDQAVAVRSNFNPLAAFSPTVKTNSDGKATVEIKMPDNLTRYRIVAVSVAGERHFGKGESSLTARLPLMVRPSPPRFLNFGDTFKLPIVVQNQTDAPMTVRVAVRATNASLTDGTGREVSVPANDRVEVQFPAAAQMAGTARFQIVGVSGSNSDAAELALPVWTPATTEAFATYGVIDDGAVKQAIALPGKVVTQFGGLEVTTASTNLQALTDALLYLVHYPFECAEQRASRVMAIAALKDVLTAFKTKDMPSQAAMEASVKTDIERLSQMQNGDGGFAFWDRGRPSEPYLTVFVANALSRAKNKGFTVPPEILGRAKPYLKDIESHYPWYYGKDVRWAISSYALYTRKLMGDLDVAKGQRLIREAGGVDKLSMEADGWLLGLFAGDKAAADDRKAIVRHALNKVSETAGAANFTTGYGDGKYLLLASDRRVDGVMLESLIQDQKGEAGRGAGLDLIPKVVTGLLAHRKAGRWLNTQENSFVLVALDEYFQTYEKATPDFVARAWLGNDYAGDKAFKGRSTDYYQIDIAMKDVATHDKSDLTIQKDGTGRLYYRIGMTYAPASLKLDPADYGFVVERKYEALDDPKDVTRTADGTWHVKAGARVRVNLTMVNENRRYQVALVDPMPAGFEAMNPALAVTGPIPLDPKEQKSRGAYWWWYGPWYEHQNLRDERVEAFAALLWEGVHTYQYVARATTPGNFVVPPPKAEEMYMPETFGRGGSDRVIVE